MTQKPSYIFACCPVGLQEQKIPSVAGIRYFYQPGELEGDSCRMTDPVWSLQVYWHGCWVTKPDELVFYYLLCGSPRDFVQMKVLVVPPDSQLLLDGVLHR